MSPNGESHTVTDLDRMPLRITVTEKYTHVASPMARDAAERMGSVL